MTCDFCLSHCGSLFILTPLTPPAHAWIGEHIADDAHRWAGGIVIEPRYVVDVITGIFSDGMVVEV